MRLLVALLSLFSLASAQFGFFDQMFGQQEQHHGHHHQQQQQNNPSDASHYHARYEGSVCDKYLCPDSLACVHFPHHCPCIWDQHEDKFEFGEGKRLCASRGGFKDGEAARKIELARKGLL
ncbi:uncharacterized protein LMH87_008683 [Akanthomyces muscarius]|uniref:Long chronological lifespan protein 2 n=1 Tax=Akanthomyces muscarius TaxID=2231603 RepID=A0A9W8QGU8_AKAMU|nr:uncharacterized protein LMH87_008683 [Akanthomyces muscarius]KAJ4158144.1 hypothetical protein LMH87_008683 [Akanthomyces muscarius]